MEYKMRLCYANGGEGDGSVVVCARDGVEIVRADWNGENREPLRSDRGAEIFFPAEEIDAFMADRRHSEFWCMPVFGDKLTDVPTETQYLLIRYSDGSCRVIVPVVSEDYKCVLEGGADGLRAVLFSWCEGICACRGIAFVTARGENPYALTEACVKTALAELHNGCAHRSERRYPEIFEYLGWCSWDAMQIRVSEEGLLRKCKEFRDKKIPVRWAILDDMWAEVAKFDRNTYDTREAMFRLMHSSAMTDYEASHTRFPNGLAHCLTRMRTEYNMIPAIWHPTTGYWMGLEKDGPAAAKLSPYTTTSIDGKCMGDWHEDKAYGYYNTMHRFFRDCGAAFVKVDNQSMYRRFYRGMDTVGRVCREYHRGLEASVGVNFGGDMINCMGMASEDMWNRPTSAISRCSDDFQPENRPWFTKHILQCTYNSLIQGQFYWSDYDMWWTDDSQGPKNSVLRAVSGGPIYVSDELDRSRAEIIAPLAFADGRILRCDRPGMPARDCLFADPETAHKPLKIQNLCGGSCGSRGSYGSAVIAAFHIDRDNTPIVGTIRPEDAEGIAQAEEYAVYEHFSGEMTILRAGEALSFTLADHDDFRLYIIVPVADGFAPIGLVDKYISPLGITAQIGETVALYEHGRYGYVKAGKLYIEER